MSQTPPKGWLDLEIAITEYKTKLEREEKAGNKEGMATAYGNLGTTYLTMGELDQAEDMFKKSLEVEETPDNKGIMATVYGYLGDICRLRNNLNQAEDMYNKALNLFEAIGSERMIEIMRTMLKNLKMKKKQG